MSMSINFLLPTGTNAVLHLLMLIRLRLRCISCDAHAGDSELVGIRAETLPGSAVGNVNIYVSWFMDCFFLSK